MIGAPPHSEASRKKRGNILLIAFFTVLASFAAVTLVAYLDNLTLSSMIDAERASYERNVLEQGGALNRVVFAVGDLLLASSREGSGPKFSTLVGLAQGAINQARIPEIIEPGFLDAILGDDPLFLAERSAKSNERYNAHVSAMAGQLERAQARGETAAGEAILRELVREAGAFMEELRDRSRLFLQIEGAYQASSRRSLARLHAQISLNLIEFSLLIALLVVVSIFYFKSRLSFERELQAHRDNLSMLVEERTEELGSANERLRSALGEREVLIKEVYHRVKNNLAIVASLISLQHAETRPENLEEAFDKLGRRVNAIALIHEKLYRSADLASIAFKDYAADLCNTLIYSLSANPAAISFALEATDDRFPADTLIPLGLIITELVTNSLKYAFLGRPRGGIAISLAKSEGGYRLEVRDDGKPPAEKRTILESSSLGVRLVTSLVAQIGGSLELDLSGGTGVIIRFPRR